MRYACALLLLTIAACDSTETGGEVEKPPVFSHEIEVTAQEKVMLGIDAAPWVLNLHHVFRHKDGRALSFTSQVKQASGRGIADVVLSDSLLTITPLSHGSGEVHLKASALDGAQAEFLLPVHVEVPDQIQIVGSPVTDGHLVIKSSAEIPVRSYFLQTEGKPLVITASSAPGSGITARVRGDSLLVIMGEHEARGQVTLTAIDRGRPKSISFEALVNRRWCPEPTPGFVSYLPLNTGQQLAFSLNKENTSAGYPSVFYTDSLSAAVTWEVLDSSCLDGLQTYTVRERASGELSKRGNLFPLVVRDTSWTKEFSIRVTPSGEIALASYLPDFPSFPVFYDERSSPQVEFKKDAPTNRANGTFWRAGLERTHGLMFIQRLHSSGGAGHTDSNFFRLERN